MSCGVAFDTNLLSKPLSRRVMLLWMELSGQPIVVLPTVRDELLYKRPHAQGKDRDMDEMFADAWLETWEHPDSPYENVELDRDQGVRYGNMLDAFTLRCFPQVKVKERISRHLDAKVIAEAVATGMDMVVTNNMASIDHTEVNALVRVVTSSNESFLSTADDALLHAHVGAEASRHMLTMFLAATWPDQGLRQMSVSDCHAHLASCASKLSTGVAMPQCATKLQNAFAVDEELDVVIRNARMLAQDSRSLAIDNEHSARIRSGLKKLRLAPVTVNQSATLENYPARTLA